MSATGTGPVGDRTYSKLMDEGTDDPSSHRTDAGHSGRPVFPVFPVTAIPWPRSPGPYRLATICLATLSAVLLISIIAVAAHHKNKPQGGGGGDGNPGAQRQDANVSSLTAAISKLQREKEELLARLSAAEASEGIGPTARAAPPIVCPPDWRLFNRSCYFISETTMDWPESQSYCQIRGGYLAIIHTAAEQTFLWDLLPRGHWNAFWFGVTDEHTEDQWRWVDGTPLLGGFWEVGEPNNHIDEDCGYIVKTLVLERVAIRSWYDAPCSMHRSFICEREMGAG